MAQVNNANAQLADLMAQIAALEANPGGPNAARVVPQHMSAPMDYLYTLLLPMLLLVTRLVCPRSLLRTASRS